MDIQELSSPLIPTEFYNNTHNEPSNNFFNENINTKDNLSDQKGFEYHKRRVEYNNDNIVCKRTYKCTKAAQYQPRKDKDPEKYHQRSSGSIGCQWHLNVTCPKSTEFSEEMKSDILDIYIYRKNLYNAIQEVRRCKRIEEKDDAENILQDLYNLQKEDPDWIIKTCIIGNDFHLGSVLWISSQRIRFHDVVITDG
ncbi:hypothetical protein C1646_750815 [Rhizophagus diaphanus]|nr:hypothetical protein C1646_750815 [Rhizophagus diaphanus] [Rhizophagus sp. MUCL 43196]